MSNGQWFASETGGQGIWTLSESASGSPTYTLTLDAGTVTVSGSAALRDLSMVLEPGTVSVTGQAAALLAGRRLVGDAGSVNVAGHVAGLLAARRLAADAGVVTVSGQDATLTSATYSLALDAGVVSIGGQAITFLRTYRLAAQAGVVNVSGQVAILSIPGSDSTAQSPTGYYRRMARDVLAGRRDGAGASVMLAIGARRRRGL